jgi:hypothetical protein
MKLHELSRKAAREDAVIVWPEGAIPDFLPADIGSVNDAPVLPWLGDGSAFLVGTYAQDRDKNGTMPRSPFIPTAKILPHFKQI